MTDSTLPENIKTVEEKEAERVKYDTPQVEQKPLNPSNPNPAWAQTT